MENYYKILEIDYFSKTDEVRKAMQKYAQRPDADLAVLQACKQHLLNEKAREDYNAKLLQADEELRNALAARSKQIAAQRRQARRDAERGIVPEPQGKPQKRGCLDYVGLFVTALICAIIFANCDSLIGRGGGQSRNHADGALAACKAAVKNHVKVPSEADFSNWQVRVNDNGKTYTVTGLVASPNDFGVKVQNTFMCIADFNGGSFDTRVVF